LRGCQYQHLAYAEQLAWKQRQVAELLKHMAGVEFPVAAVHASPMELGYRSKITPHFNPPRDHGAIAHRFLRQGTRFDIVDVPALPDRHGCHQRAPQCRAGGSPGARRCGGFARGATVLLREASGR